ncbi:SDR family oxidoreductase [Mucilaginibacter terrenus]|uniref:SDR family oxidoreductase n=1 Tax=Mucilaginibacter terrenus TaxID=2482727 RepID=A0A3E2NWQ0_9SPHI|nr:SDR family oxidoreductase [Mucilaginibacter terrenus]RFZ85389.1 SDR family oxidoreductase [Mucilaginibacter terrenus]
MTISILGCGWYGFALAKQLISEGMSVKGSTTSADKVATLTEAGITAFLIDTGLDTELPGEFFSCDVLIISIPPKTRKGEGDGYITKLQKVIAASESYEVKKVIFISSTGVYADQSNTVTETSNPQPDTPSGVILLAAEQLFTDNKTFKTTIIRFGGLVGPGRDPGRFFAGKKDIPNGLAPVNLIHLDDCIGITKAVLMQDKFGCTINACTPHHPAKFIYYTQSARKSGLELPQFVPELKQWKIVTSEVVGKMIKYDSTLTNWYDWIGYPIEY